MKKNFIYTLVIACMTITSLISCNPPETPKPEIPTAILIVTNPSINGEDRLDFATISYNNEIIPYERRKNVQFEIFRIPVNTEVTVEINPKYNAFKSIGIHNGDYEQYYLSSEPARFEMTGDITVRFLLNVYTN